VLHELKLKFSINFLSTLPRTLLTVFSSPISTITVHYTKNTKDIYTFSSACIKPKKIFKGF